MSKKHKKAVHQRGIQVVTLCISTTMVLVLLGLVVLSVLVARNLSKSMRENLTVTLVLNDTLTVNDGHMLCRDLYHRSYTRNVDYIGKEQARQEMSAVLGTDPTEFLGANILPATVEVQLKADYANRDSLRWIAKELERNPKVTDVTYQKDLMDKVNDNLSKVSAILLVLAALLTVVSFSLINNSVRLSVYSRRFTIHTMKLVGASWSFIRWPFMRMALGVGLVAALLACVVLGACVYSMYQYQPGSEQIVTWLELTITGVSVFLFGIVITALCSYVSVGRFLRMTAGELYKI